MSSSVQFRFEMLQDEIPRQYALLCIGGYSYRVYVSESSLMPQRGALGFAPSCRSRGRSAEA